MDNSETGNNADFCNGCFAPDIYDFNTKTIFKLMETISKTEESPMTVSAGLKMWRKRRFENANGPDGRGSEEGGFLYFNERKGGCIS